MSANPNLDPSVQPHLDEDFFVRKVMLGLEYFGIIANQISRDHGFWEEFQQTHAILADGSEVLAAKYVVDTKLSKMALVQSEVSEAVEGIRKPKMDEHVPEFTSEEVELADALIRIVEYGTQFNLRIPEAVIAKMAYNRSRPFKHGKAA